MFLNMFYKFVLCNLLFSLNISFSIFFSLLFSPASSQNIDANHVNVLMYHRFGEASYPSTNIKMSQFEDHVKELKKDQYNVINLNDAIKAIKNQIQIPDRSISITIDDAYLSVFEKAWPLLKENNFTFTLFVSTDVIDRKLSNYMTWDQIRELMDNGITIGSQTKSHPHMHRLSDKKIVYEIEYSNNRFVQELGIKPTIFAYPYGEYDLKTLNIIKNSGFVAAFGQHSGVAHISAGLFELPRFAMNENYGNMDRLKLSINALPMVVNDISPIGQLLKENPPNFGFTLSPEIKPNKIVRCFASNGITTNTSRLGKFRIEVRLDRAFPKERGRINCTMEGGNGRWRWFGRQFLTK